MTTFRELPPEQAELLLQKAKEAARHAYAPYSEFPVGAALLDEAGQIYMGVNIENASYGLTMCAERVAIGNARLQGSQKWQAVAVWAEKRPYGAITPCGACRQVLSEFALPEAIVIGTHPQTGTVQQWPMQTLLPYQFSGDFKQ